MASPERCGVESETTPENAINGSGVEESVIMEVAEEETTTAAATSEEAVATTFTGAEQHDALSSNARVEASTSTGNNPPTNPASLADDGNAPDTVPIDPNGTADLMTPVVTEAATADSSDSKPAATAPDVAEADDESASKPPFSSSVTAVAELAAAQEEEEGNVFDGDASNYSLKDLRQFQQQQCSIFSMLNFTHVRSDILLKLFPKTYDDQLLPPRTYRVSAALVKQWQGMTRKEQEKVKEKEKKAEERKKRAEKRTATRMTSPTSSVVATADTEFHAHSARPTVAALVGKPLAPPLSRPIQFLEGKLLHVRLYYPRVPEGLTDWTNNAAVAEAFPMPRGYPGRIVPQCLLLDAQTEEDKLTIVNWWRFLTKEEQRAQCEELKRVYAAPSNSNRKLPPDFWEKIQEYEERRLEKLKKPRVLVDPTGNDFYMKREPKPKKEKPEKPKDTSCRGWRGGKYDQLFRASYREAIESITMESGAKILETIPVSEQATRCKSAKDLIFRREGDGYVLRSVGCTGTRMEGKGRFHCEVCKDLANHVCTARTAVGKIKKDVEGKQKERLNSVQRELSSTRRREKRLRAKLAGLKNAPSIASHTVDVEDDDSDKATPKKQRVDGSPRAGSHISPRRLPMHVAAFVQNNGYEQHPGIGGYHY